MDSRSWLLDLLMVQLQVGISVKVVDYYMSIEKHMNRASLD